MLDFWILDLILIVWIAGLLNFWIFSGLLCSPLYPPALDSFQLHSPARDNMPEASPFLPPVPDSEPEVSQLLPHAPDNEPEASQFLPPAPDNEPEVPQLLPPAPDNELKPSQFLRPIQKPSTGHFFSFAIPP